MTTKTRSAASTKMKIIEMRVARSLKPSMLQVKSRRAPEAAQLAGYLCEVRAACDTDERLASSTAPYVGIGGRPAAFYVALVHSHGMANIGMRPGGARAEACSLKAEMLLLHLAMRRQHVDARRADQPCCLTICTPVLEQHGGRDPPPCHRAHRKSINHNI